MFVCIYYECALICVYKYVSVCVNKIYLHKFSLFQQKGWLEYIIYHDARIRRPHQLLNA